MMAAQRTIQRLRHGFTMTEMLVIIGIILLVLAIALPAFTAIIGSRSIESARNIVSASVTRARGEAIRRGQPCGVYFYVDPDTGRTGIGIVTLDPLSDLDRYDEYKSFSRGLATSMNPTGLPVPQRDYQGGSYDPLNATTAGPTPTEDEPAMTADRAVVMGQDVHPFYSTPGSAYANFNGRPIIVTLLHTSHDIAGAINPGLTAPGDTAGFEPEPVRSSTGVDSSTPEVVGAPGMSNDYWAFDEIGSLELIDGIKNELLPPGVGLQVVLGQALQSSAPSPAGDGPPDADGYKYAIPGDGAPPPTDPNNPEFLERYVRSGLILFDAEGHLVQEPYRIYASSRLGRVMGLELVDEPPPAAPGTPIEEYLVQNIPAALGVVIYDRDAFEGAASEGTSMVWKGGFIASMADPPTTLDDFTTSEGDVTFIYPPADRPLAITATPPVGDYRFHEYAEERWLDASTIPLMVNRYSGVLSEAD